MVGVPSGVPGEAPSDIALDAMAAAHARILRTCTFAGLTRIDAEDIAQDVWVWLIKSGRWDETRNLTWLRGVAVNFARRHWRARTRRSARESQAAAGSARLRDTGIDLDTKLSLDELEQMLPSVESALLRLVRRGLSFAEAARSLGIRRGSQDYFRKRLHGQVSSSLARTLAIPGAPVIRD